MSEPAPTERTGYRWYVAVLLSGAYLVSMLDRFIMGVIMVPLKTDLNLSDSELGLLFGTAFAIFFVLIGLPLGRVADVWNRTRLIAVGLVLWSLATAVSAFAQTFSGLFTARMAVGVGEACLAPAAMSLIAAWFPKHLLARATSIYTMGAPLGRATAFLGGGALLSALIAIGGIDVPLLGHFAPWQACFLVAALPGLLLGAIFFTVDEPARPPVPPHSERDGRSGLAGAVAHFSQNFFAYATHIGAFTIVATMSWALSAWAASYYVRDHGLSLKEAGAIVGIGGLISPAGHLLGGYIMDRMTAAGVQGSPVLTVTLALFASVLPAVLFCTAETAAFATAGYLILQITISCVGAPGYAGVQMITPDRFRGISTSFFVAFFSLVSLGAGPLIVGIVSDRGDPASTDLGFALLVTLLALDFIGIAIALAGRRHYAAAVRKLAV
jgi:MFS family permease